MGYVQQYQQVINMLGILFSVKTPTYVNNVYKCMLEYTNIHNVILYKYRDRDSNK